MSQSEPLHNIVEAVSDVLTPGELDAAGRPHFSFNRLATPPLRPRRKFLGLLTVFEVLPGTWGLCYRGDATPTVLSPGTYWFTLLDGGPLTVQLVDATRRQHVLPPVSGLTRDGWRVTLQVVLTFEVVDPVAVARTAGALPALEAAGRAAILAQIETMPHQALMGPNHAPETAALQVIEHSQPLTPNPPPLLIEPAGLQVIEHGLLARLRERPGLAGLHVVEVAVVERVGDERLVEIMRAAEVERARVVEERLTATKRAELAQTRLEAEAQTVATARLAAIIQAETQAQLAAIEEQTRLLAAQTDADVAEIQQTQQAREAERKRLAEEWRTAKELDLRAMEYQHAETLAIIQGTAQVTAEAAKAGLLDPTSESLWPRPANAEVVGQGIQTLGAFRDKIAPPVTHFLPPVGAGLRPEEPDRLQAESLRLERVRGATHELILRRGQLAAARVWFTAPAALAGVRLELACPEGYPLIAPLLTLYREDQAEERPLPEWDAGLFLADVVRDVMVELLA